MKCAMCATITSALVLAALAAPTYGLSYVQSFDVSGSEAVFDSFSDGPGTSTMAYLPSEQAVQLQLTGSTRTGHYTYGPGKTFIPTNSTLRQSLDIYIDPSIMTAGTASVWTMEVLLRKADGGAAGEFDFFGKWVQDDGEGDANFEDLDGDGETADWIYKLGRNNDWRSDPTVVTEAGWYTFTTEWVDDGTTLTNHNYISQNGTVLFQGDAVKSPWTSNPLGYETGYMWIYGRDRSTATLKLDNLRYELVSAAPIPEPITAMALLAGISGVGGYLRRRKG